MSLFGKIIASLKYLHLENSAFKLARKNHYKEALGQLKLAEKIYLEGKRKHTKDFVYIRPCLLPSGFLLKGSLEYKLGNYSKVLETMHFAKEEILRSKRYLKSSKSYLMHYSNMHIYSSQYMLNLPLDLSLPKEFKNYNFDKVDSVLLKDFPLKLETRSLEGKYAETPPIILH